MWRWMPKLPDCCSDGFQMFQWRRQGGFLDTFPQLPPRFIMHIILHILPLVIRLMQQSVSFLLHSSSFLHPTLLVIYNLFLSLCFFIPPCLFLTGYFLFLINSLSFTLMFCLHHSSDLFFFFPPLFPVAFLLLLFLLHHSFLASFVVQLHYYLSNKFLIFFSQVVSFPFNTCPPL